MSGRVGNDGSSLTCYANTKKDPDFVEKFGCLYTWEDAKKICPAGWHLPVQKDFENLLTLAGNNENITLPNPAFLALSAKDEAWTCDYGDQTSDTFSFGALPAGFWDGNKYRAFGHNAHFWSSSALKHTYAFMLLIADGQALAYNHYQVYARSVRCIKD